MDRAMVARSLKAIKKIAYLVGRSQDPGHRVSQETAQKMELDMILHLEAIRKELGLVREPVRAAVPAVLVATASTSS